VYHTQASGRLEGSGAPERVELPLFVPIVLFAMSAAAAGKGGVDLWRANGVRASAAERKQRARQRHQADALKSEIAQQVLQEDHAKLVDVQLAAIAQLEEVVAWLRKGRVADADWDALPAADRPDPGSWARQAVDARGVLRDAALSAAGAAGASAAALQVAGHVGVASTGAAISGLSGAAARSATLAWLGGGSLLTGGGGMALGGMVLSGLNVGGAVLGAGYTARKVAASYETSVVDFEAAVRTEGVRQRGLRELWFACRRRMNQLRRATNAIGHATRRMLEDGDPTQDADWLAMVHLAKALGALARYRVTDEAGALAAAWTNPYEPLAALGLSPADVDFTRGTDEPDEG
jgi:hypothetical protein